MFGRDDIVLIDTNVILEAHRVGCWNTLAGRFKLVTVEKVIEETQTGYQNRSPERTIDLSKLRASFHHIEPITELERAGFILSYRGVHLDDGERDLVIYALRLPVVPVWYLNSPDRASINFASSQNWLDRVVSLQEMADFVGYRANCGYGKNYTKSWLNNAKLDYRMGRV